MNLDLQITSTDSVLHEPVRVHFAFTNDAKACAFPYEPTGQDAMTLSLFDAGGNLLAQANGYAMDQRLGIEPCRRPQTAMVTGELAGGAVAEWDEDLLSYFDLSLPGTYQIQASFNFIPSGLVAESKRMPFEIKPLRCVAFDVTADRVALQLLYLVQQHRSAESEPDSRIIVQLRTPKAPDKPWQGVSLDGMPDAPVRISEADFVTVASFDGDFALWLAWADSAKLWLLAIQGMAFHTPIVEALDFKSSGLVGRPIQHDNGGVSVLLSDADQSQGNAIIRLDFDANGTRIAKTRIVLPPVGNPVGASCDASGNSFLICAKNGGLPLSLVQLTPQGKTTVTALLTELPPDSQGRARSGARVLKAAFDLKPDAERAALVMATGYVGATDEAWACAATTTATMAGKPDTHCRFWPLTGTATQAAAPLAMDVARRGESGVTAIAVTIAGAVLYLTESGDRLDAGTVAPDLAGQAALLTTGQLLHLYLPDRAQGARYTALAGQPGAAP